MLVCYHLYNASSASGVSVATATVLNRGTIVGVVITAVSLAGAGEGRLLYSLQLNDSSTVQAAVASPNRNIILATMAHALNNAVTTAQTTGFIPQRRGVIPGDVINLGIVAVGTARSGVTDSVDVYVEEAG